MDLKCNGRLLQLIECIESIKSDVKKKMTLQRHATHVPKSPRGRFAGNFLCSSLLFVVGPKNSPANESDFGSLRLFWNSIRQMKISQRYS